MVDDDPDGDEDGAEGLAQAAAEYLGIDLERYPRRRRERLIETWRAAPGDPQETLRAALCVGETMFLRHQEHFQALQGLAMELPGYGRGGVRVWSAGCATGEEAFTLAATLRRVCGDQLQVIASDVRKDFLAHAAKGRYGPWSLRGVDIEAHLGWLRPDGAGAQVEDGVRQLVRFQELNLKRGLYPAELDVIFCRNVLLYFRVEDAHQVFRDMADVARLGAVLFIGYQDPRPEPEDGWTCERHGDVEFFRRALPGDAATAPPGLRSASATSAPPALAGGQSRPPGTSMPPPRSVPPAPSVPPARSLPPPSSLPPGADAPTEPRVSGAPPLAPGSPPPPEVEAGLVEARARAGSGDVTGALEHLELLTEAYPDEVAPCVLAALLAEEAGDAQLVVRFARRACFLAPDAVVPNLMMGFGLDALDQGEKARRYYRLAADGVRRVGDRSGALPDGEGLTALQVERMLDGRDD